MGVILPPEPKGGAARGLEQPAQGAPDEREAQPHPPAVDLRTLEQERRLHVADLEQAHRTIDKESRKKSLLLSGMSHELRTPLNSIIGFAELLEQELAGPLLPRQSEYLSHVISSGRQMLSLVNDMLDLSKIEAGRMEILRQWVTISELTESALIDMGPLARKRNITLTFENAAEVLDLYIDKLRIRQVLSNLLSNAIKFTPPGGAVSLRIDESDDLLQVAVHDNGIGISAEQLEYLFRAFSRFAYSSHIDNTGGGLGLILSKRVIEMHGGEISVQSQEAVGSTFRFTLPILRRKPRATHRTPGFRDLSKVVVVEDDLVSREALVQKLHLLGLCVSVASNADDALRLTRELRPATMFLELRLPGPDGWTVARQIQNDPTLSTTAVIMVSVLEPPPRGDELGIQDYLQKPISLEALKLALQRVGVQHYEVGGLRVLLIGCPQPHLLAIEKTLIGAGCSVRRVESMDSLVDRATCDLFIIDGVGGAANPRSDETLTLALQSGLGIILLVDSEAEEAQAKRQRVRPLALADAFDLPHLIRAISLTARKDSH